MTSAALADVAWDRLRNEPSQSSADLGVPSLPLETRTPAGPVRLAIGADEEARLLVPVLPGDPFPQISEARGLVLKDSVFQVSGRPVRFIDLVCKERQLDAVFKDVVAAVLARVEKKESAIQAVEGAISDFRNLLLSAGGREISSARAIGLLAELTLLERLLMKNKSAWRAWTGPSGGRHDFRAGPLAIEVKASLRTQSKTIQISALDQLAEPDGGKLFLFHRVFEEDAGGALTVPTIVSKLLARAADPQGFSELLSSAGYEAGSEDQWEEFRFSALSEDTYAVGPGFPRLVPADFESGELPVGVSHFRYRVDLAVAEDFRSSDEIFEKFLQSFVSCLQPA